MKGSTVEAGQVLGLDVGDRVSHLCIREQESGTILEELRVRTTRVGLERVFESRRRGRVVLEVGTHSPWISRLLSEMGYDVFVADARKLELITRSRRKTDRIDAAILSELGRNPSQYLARVTHRKAVAQQAMALLRARDALVRSRTALVLHCRGAVKSWGGRLPSCAAKAFALRVEEHLPEPLRAALVPVLEQIQRLSDQIRLYDRQIETLCQEQFPETERLRQVPGVGPILSLRYVLTIQDPGRFRRSREVGPYLGLVAGERQSGRSRRPLGITKEGDRVLRSLLVQSAHYVLGRFGRDCDLRRFGERVQAAGGPAAKRKAVVAVARKLAVLLHRLWQSGRPYDPFYGASGSGRETALAS